MSNDIKAQLISNGFIANESGVEFSKVFYAEDMPYFVEHIIDNEYVFGRSQMNVIINLAHQMVAIREVCSSLDGYMEGPYRFKEGAAANILSDVGICMTEDLTV